MPANHLILCLSFPPCPLSRVLSCLLALNNPPPRAWEAPTNKRSAIADGVSILPASRHAVPLSHYRSFATAAAYVVVAVPSSACFVIAPASSSRLRVMSATPLAPPLLSRNGEGLRADCGLFGCHRLACLPNAVSRLGRFNSLPSRPVVLVRSCCFACADGGCVRCREVAFACFPVGAF